MQRVQGGVAAPEIIHPYREAESPETVDLLQHELKIEAEGALRDLHGYHVPAKPRSVHALPDLLDNIAGIEVGAGEIDGMGDNGKPHFLLVLHLFQHLLQHAEVELIDESHVLQVRDKLRRREKAPLGVNPPGKRLLVAHMPAHRPDNRLVIHGDPALPDGPLQV